MRLDVHYNEIRGPKDEISCPRLREKQGLGAGPGVLWEDELALWAAGKGRVLAGGHLQPGVQHGPLGRVRAAARGGGGTTLLGGRGGGAPRVHTLHQPALSLKGTVA